MGLIGGLANRIKAITGKASWRDTPDAALADAANHHARQGLQQRLTELSGESHD